MIICFKAFRSVIVLTFSLPIFEQQYLKICESKHHRVFKEYLISFLMISRLIAFVLVILWLSRLIAFVLVILWLSRLIAFVLVILWLLMFKFGITGIAKLGFFNFSGAGRVNQLPAFLVVVFFVSFFHLSSHAIKSFFRNLHISTLSCTTNGITCHKRPPVVYSRTIYHTSF